MKRVHALVALAMCACASDGPPAPVPGSASASGSSAVEGPIPEKAAVGRRIGSAIALDGARLVVADEDHRALWQLGLPLEGATRIGMPGAPAQLVVIPAGVLVTIRDPGLLLLLASDLTEKARVELAADAWGLAVSDNTAVVTSAWTHTVTAVDLGTMKVRWSLDVAREPRAVVLRDDVAYVSHLIGSELTRIEGVSGTSPTAKRIALPPAPSLSAPGHEPSASLGYAAVLAPDETRLFVARHALGALGSSNAVPTWMGAATVDVLRVPADEPLSPSRSHRALARLRDYLPAEESSRYSAVRDTDGPGGPIPLVGVTPFVQPRAIVYRKATSTLLVASEGGDELIELDALALEPALFLVKRYRLTDNDNSRVSKSGGAPSAIALSEDDSTAYVFCRSTYDVMAVPLVAYDRHAGQQNPKLVHLADDPLLEGIEEKDPRRKPAEAAALGRRYFYNALDHGVSGGMGCAGCHPEGRDDGHVWHQMSEGEGAFFVGGPGIVMHHGTEVVNELIPIAPSRVLIPGAARQTPMLTGRVRLPGPYGWQAENKTLVDRISAGFQLHRWNGEGAADAASGETRARVLAAFLRKGLVSPPRPKRELSADEARGKELFLSDKVGCAACHVPEDDYTNMAAVKLTAPGARKGFVDESDDAFRTPSLLHVGGTAPYFHDGSAATLEALVSGNADRMGRTSHLSPDDQRALIAFLRTL